MWISEISLQSSYVDFFHYVMHPQNNESWAGYDVWSLLTSFKRRYIYKHTVALTGIYQCFCTLTYFVLKITYVSVTDFLYSRERWHNVKSIDLKIDSSDILKPINYSCVQLPTGFLDLGHMNASGHPVKHWPVLHRVFIWHLILREASCAGDDFSSPIICQTKGQMKHWWKHGSTCARVHACHCYWKSPAHARSIA